MQIIHCLKSNLKYIGRPPWDTNQSPPELLEFIQTHPAGKALDLGCGTGMNCLTLAKAGWQTTGIDFAWRAIQLARKRFKEDGLTGQFRMADVTKLAESANTFDLVLDIGCYHSLPAASRMRYQMNVACWLRNGGSYLLYGHKPSENRTTSTNLTEADILQFQESLLLVNRQDCEDRRGRKIVWLWFMKPGK